MRQIRRDSKVFTTRVSSEFLQEEAPLRQMQGDTTRASLEFLQEEAPLRQIQWDSTVFTTRASLEFLQEEAPLRQIRRDSKVFTTRASLELAARGSLIAANTTGQEGFHYKRACLEFLQEEAPGPA